MKQHIFTKVEAATKVARLLLNDQIFDQHYIVLEDLRQGLAFPCILDIKMGSKAYNPVKIARQSSKISSSSSGTHGFRLCGFTNYSKSEDGYEKVTVDKYHHRQVTGDLIASETAQFFARDATSHRHEVVKAVADQVANIRSVVLKHSAGVKFYGASILVIYCAEAADSGTFKGAVKMIDY